MDSDAPDVEKLQVKQFTKVYVNLVPRSIEALYELSMEGEGTKTESINRAIQLYRWINRQIKGGQRKLALIEYRWGGGKIHVIEIDFY